MAITVLIGAQWGDEGKGKIIDVLTEKVDWVVRYQGGNNAGHTVEIGSERYVLHLIPSGILRPGTKNVIGHGVVVDPVGLVKEITDLEQRGVDLRGRFFLSDRAHLVLPYHSLLDASREQAASANTKIGTTKRGIGPAYGDKAARVGLRAGDLLDPVFPDLLRRRVEDSNRILGAWGQTPLDFDKLLADCRAATAKLAPYIADTIPLLNEAITRKESILFEGAQGTMLDIDFGTYPFVTSSSATAGGACTGAGVAPHRIDRVIGVIKAYTTRVGEGPFPTELHDAMGAQLRENGHEFGATTGRPRRCGWFDVVVARYSAMLNGVDAWALTKLDVLDDVKVIKICVAYECDGKRLTTVPGNIRQLERCKPIYKEFEGWNCKTTGATRFSELPTRAQAYVQHLEKLTGVKVGILSVGPRRASTMQLVPISD